MLRTKARSIGRRFLAWNSGRRLLRSASVGLPSPGPHERVERQPSHPIGLPLSEQRGPQCARRDAVDQERGHATGSLDVIGRRLEVVGAVGDVGIDRPALVGPAVALHVHAPGVVAQADEMIHRRGIGPARNLKVERRRRGHGRAVDEQDRAERGGRNTRALFPQEELDPCLVRPVFTTAGHRASGDAHRSGGKRQGPRLIPPSARRCTPGVGARAFDRTQVSEADPRGTALRVARKSAVVGCHRPRGSSCRRPATVGTAIPWPAPPDIDLDLHRRGRAGHVAGGQRTDGQSPRASSPRSSPCSGCSRRSLIRACRRRKPGSAAGRQGESAGRRGSVASTRFRRGRPARRSRPPPAPPGRVPRPARRRSFARADFGQHWGSPGPASTMSSVTRRSAMLSASTLTRSPTSVAVAGVRRPSRCPNAAT